MSAQAVSADSVRAALKRVLTSKQFAKAAVKSEILRFIVEETLHGRGDRLNESVLGNEA